MTIDRRPPADRRCPLGRGRVAECAASVMAEDAYDRAHAAAEPTQALAAHHARPRSLGEPEREALALLSDADQQQQRELWALLDVGTYRGRAGAAVHRGRGAHDGDARRGRPGRRASRAALRARGVVVLTYDVVATEVISEPTPDERQPWEELRRRAARRTLVEAERRPSLVGACVPTDLLGRPTKPLPGGRRHTELANCPATGYAPKYADLVDVPPPDLDWLDDELWADADGPRPRPAAPPRRTS